MARWRWRPRRWGRGGTRGVTATEIVLGTHTDLSGPAATYGVSSSNAVKMRFDEVNDQDGIHSRKIKLIVKRLESIKGYKDIFNGPEASFGPDKRASGVWGARRGPP